MSSQILVIRKALFTKRTFERPFVQMDVANVSLHAVFGFEQFPAIAAAEFPVDVNLAFVTDQRESLRGGKGTHGAFE